MGEGEARPTGLQRTVKGREGGVVRPAAEGEDTARLDDDARDARRLPLDRPGQVCWADTKGNKNSSGTG